MKKKGIKIILALILFIIAMVIKFQNEWINNIIFIISYIIVGFEILRKAIRNIFRGKVFDENFLMSVATLGAFGIGEFPEAVAVMLFYQIGELFQSYAVDKSRRSIASLMDIRPDYANVYKDGQIEKVNPSEVKIGDTIVVKPGEKIPLDGHIIEGKTTLDTKALTGESLPREVTEGEDVLSGCINLDGLIKIEVTKEYGESTVSKILDLVENASSKKSKSENFITKFAKYYTPIVVLIALILAIFPPLLIPGANFSDWIYRALSFLVVSCPCALVISIPLSFFGGIGGASKMGVLVKGSNYLEALANTEITVFDKTGTFTKCTDVGTILYVAIQGKYAGYILISDKIKEDAKYTIEQLKKNNIKQTVMLTGDRKDVGENVAKQIGIDKVYTELLPDGKVQKVEELLKTKSEKGKLAFVGDGINDAPVLALADIGIAMGGLGADSAIEAADIVIMTDEPSKIVNAIKLSKKTMRIVKENIIFAIAIKILVLILAAFGLSTMWEAVFADVGVSIIAIINALRALKG